jgi:hypothetical protein
MNSRLERYRNAVRARKRTRRGAAVQSGRPPRITGPETEVGSDPLADAPCLLELPTPIRLKYSTEVDRWTRLRGSIRRLQANIRWRP